MTNLQIGLTGLVSKVIGALEGNVVALTEQEMTVVSRG